MCSGPPHRWDPNLLFVAFGEFRPRAHQQRSLRRADRAGLQHVRQSGGGASDNSNPCVRRSVASSCRAWRRRRALRRDRNAFEAETPAYGRPLLNQGRGDRRQGPNERRCHSAAYRRRSSQQAATSSASPGRRCRTGRHRLISASAFSPACSAREQLGGAAVLVVLVKAEPGGHEWRITRQAAGPLWRVSSAGDAINLPSHLPGPGREDRHGLPNRGGPTQGEQHRRRGSAGDPASSGGAIVSDRPPVSWDTRAQEVRV